MTRRSLLWIAGLALAVIVTGCGSDTPADPDSLHDRIDRLVPPIVDETNAASASSEATLDQLGRGLDAFEVLAPGILPASESGLGLKRLAAAPADGDPTDGQAVADELNTRLFTEANYEGDGVYRVPPDLICETDPETGASDPACTSQVAEVRVRAVLAGADGVDFTLVLGAERAEPLTLALRPSAVTVEVDLGELARAATELGAVAGESAGIAVAMDGRVSARLEVVGTAHVAVSVAIDQPVHVAFADAGADPEGPDGFRIDSAEARPLIRFELDGAAAAGSLQIGLGSTQVHAPDADTGRAIDVDLPGISATASVRAGEPLRVTGIGLGDRTTTLSVNGQTAMTIDLNRDRGRRFDATITGDALDSTFAVSPAFEVRVSTDHAVLGDAAPRFDVTRVALDGASAPALRSMTLSDGYTTQLQVAAGRLTLETAPTEYGAIIDAPSCVGEELRSDASGSYSVMVATACQ